MFDFGLPSHHLNKPERILRENRYTLQTNTTHGFSYVINDFHIYPKRFAFRLHIKAVEYPAVFLAAILVSMFISIKEVKTDPFYAIYPLVVRECVNGKHDKEKLGCPGNCCLLLTGEQCDAPHLQVKSILLFHIRCKSDAP